MIRLIKSAATALGVLVLAAACATSDVAATDSHGKLTSEAELDCCQKSAMEGKKECCGKNIEGKYCPVTGQKAEG